MRGLIRLLLSLGLGIGPLGFAAFAFAGGALAQAGCQTAGTSGQTAVVVAHSGQVITGHIDASQVGAGCDLGIYVGPGVTHVTIAGATVTGATEEGILIQDTGWVTVSGSTVTGNAPAGEQGFDELKGIVVLGSNHVTVVGNNVSNNGGGGISVVDDGGYNPSGPNPGMARPSSYNTVAGNQVIDNSGGCGIVVAAYNPGEGVDHNRVAGNTVRGNPAGIIVAADAPYTTATSNAVVSNTSTGNEYSGLIVHSNSFGDVVSNTTLQGNQVSGNMPFGIIVAADVVDTPPGEPVPVLTHTSVIGNVISNEQVGIGHDNDTASVFLGNVFINVAVHIGQGD